MFRGPNLAPDQLRMTSDHSRTSRKDLGESLELSLGSFGSRVYRVGFIEFGTLGFALRNKMRQLGFTGLRRKMRTIRNQTHLHLILSLNHDITPYSLPA